MTIEPTPPSAHDAPPDWEALGRFLSGESDADEAATIADWLARHPDDERVIDAVQHASQQLAMSVRTSVDTERALAAVKSRVHETAPAVASIDTARAAQRARNAGASSAAPRAAGSIWQRIGAVAAVMIVATSVIVWRAQRETPPATTQIVVAPGTRDSVQLPDGTRALLGPGSTLSYAASYDESAREVVLQGEGFFEVQRDDAKPFTVRAGDALIVDLGTAFTVRTDAARGVSVAVTSGRVRLGRDGDEGAIELAAGDAGVLPGNGARAMRDSVSLEDAIAWTTGTLVFRDAPFADVASSLSRWYGVTVTADSSVRAARVTASFRGEARGTVLETLALSYGAVLDARGDSANFRIAGAAPR